MNAADKLTAPSQITTSPIKMNSTSKVLTGSQLHASLDPFESSNVEFTADIRNLLISTDDVVID